MKLHLMLLSRLLLLASVLTFTSIARPHGVHVDGDAVDADHQHEDETDTDNVGDLNSYLQETGVWRLQSGFLALTAERVAASNDWDTDADQFVLNMIRDITAIPPWQTEDRLDQAVELLGQRYSLTPAQRETAHDMIAEISRDWSAIHSDRMTACTLEAMEVRGAGELITPELVSIWSKQASEPLEDVVERFTQAVRRFTRELTPDQRQRMISDVRLIKTRENAMASMAEKWRIGTWTEATWGLDQDPVQQAARAQLESTLNQRTELAAAENSKSPAQGHANQTPAITADTPGQRSTAPSDKTGQNPTTQHNRQQTDKNLDDWRRYVQHFIQSYALTEEQALSAWRIHDRAVTLRDQAEARYTRRINALKQRGADQSSAGQRLIKSTRGQREYAINALFERMKQGLEKLPTRKQRAAIVQK